MLGNEYEEHAFFRGQRLCFSPAQQSFPFILSPHPHLPPTCFIHASGPEWGWPHPQSRDPGPTSLPSDVSVGHVPESCPSMESFEFGVHKLSDSSSAPYHVCILIHSIFIES